MGPGHSQSVFEQSRIGHAVGIHKSDIFSTRSAYSQISSRVGAGEFLDKQSHALTALRDGEAFLQGAIIERKVVVEGKSVSVRVDHGGRRIIKKIKKLTHKRHTY